MYLGCFYQSWALQPSLVPDVVVLGDERTWSNSPIDVCIVPKLLPHIYVPHAAPTAKV